MLLTVIILKSLIELSLMFIVARFLLGLLAGAKRSTNVFWQLLDVAAKPALWITRRVSPKLILDQHIPLAAASWLLMAWVLVVKVKIDLCLQLGPTHVSKTLKFVASTAPGQSAWNVFCWTGTPRCCSCSGSAQSRQGGVSGTAGALTAMTCWH